MLQDDDPLCRSSFFSPTASLMSRSQTNVWASYSRPFLRPRTCTSTRTTVLRLKTRELACGTFKLAWTTTTTILLTSSSLPSSPSSLSVLVGSREFETVHIVWTWKVKSSVAIIKNRGTQPDLMTRGPASLNSTGLYTTEYCSFIQDRGSAVTAQCAVCTDTKAILMSTYRPYTCICALIPTNDSIDSHHTELRLFLYLGQYHSDVLLSTFPRLPGSKSHTSSLARLQYQWSRHHTRLSNYLCHCPSINRCSA